MATRRYLNFDLLLEQEGEGRYQARVTSSPLGETPSVRFQLPFDAVTLENLLLKLDPGRSGTRRVGATGQQQAAMDFGGALYQTVFTGDLALAWQRALDQARASQAGGLRLRLRLSDAPAIAGLPWELLYDARSNNFLAQSEQTPVVRFLDVSQAPRPLMVDGPLRVLAIISSPIGLDELDVEAEWRRIGEALAPRIDAGLVTVDRLPSATIAELGAWLRKHKAHVIHFVGHGDFDAGLGEGVIYFQDRHGRSSPVTSSVLGPFLRDHEPLQMVVLNACRSARTDTVDPFGGMAQGLVQQNATAVVAMQFPISDRAAVTFTGEFYGALVDGLPVDQAVSSARKALLADFRDEWSTPVLFLRSPDGNIFENVHAVAGGVPEGPGSTPPPPPLDPVHEAPKPPGPSWEKTLALWLSRHRPAAAVIAVVVAAALVAGALWLLPFGGGDSRATDDATDGPTTADQTTADPTGEGRDGFPRSDPLPPSQMLVAAGNTLDGLKVWLLDTADTSQTHQVSLSRRKEWLPVLGTGRNTMIYSREKVVGSDDYELRVAEADSGDRNDALFIPPLDECADHSGRPAWWQVGDPKDWFFVLRCRKTDTGPYQLLKVGASGGIETLAIKNPIDGGLWPKMGDPTISPDGSLVIAWVTTSQKDEAGSLYGIDLTKDPEDPARSFPLAERDPAIPNQYSDVVFSPSTSELRIAYRKTAPGGNFDLWTALVDGRTLSAERPLVDTTAVEEDPSFSPDGTEVVFTSKISSERIILRRILVAEGAVAEDVTVPAGFPPIAKVPAWSIR